MQTTFTCQLTSRSSAFAGARPVQAAFSSKQTAGRRAAVEVYAGGKGKQRMRVGGSGRQQQMAAQLPPTPPVDPENAEFVLFVRSKKLPQWVPLTIMKGGGPANLLVKGLDSDLGRALAMKTLTNNIGQAVYRDRAAMESALRSQYPPLKAAKELEYGYKIRDKENPKAWYLATDVNLIPPEAEVQPGNVGDNVKDFFATTFGRDDVGQTAGAAGAESAAAAPKKAIESPADKLKDFFSKGFA